MINRVMRTAVSRVVNTNVLRARTAIIEAKGLKQITDSAEIEAEVDRIIAANPTQADQVRGGDEKVIGWFVGQVMKATRGQANPALVNQVLKQRLGG